MKPTPSAQTIACVYLPALPLQVLRRRHPDWSEHPMAVVDIDRPGGRVLWVSQRGWAAQVRPGMRYAAALSLCTDLRAGEVDASSIEAMREDLLTTLRRFSPAVERSTSHEGVFWLNVSGLGRLYASLEAWADAVEAALVSLGLSSTLVVGFDRFATFGLALARCRERVVATAERERKLLAQVPLERLQLDLGLCSGLEELGVRTVGQLLRMPRSQVVRRFGTAAERLYEQAREGARVPVQRDVAVDAVARAVDFEHTERDTTRLLWALASELPGMIGDLIAIDEVVVSLCLTLVLDGGIRIEERLRPAQPTLDEAILLDLIRLRLDGMPLEGGVVRCELVTVSRRADRTQGELTLERPRRDLAAGDRALARLRAELGDGAVGTWVESDGHLPEAASRWEPWSTLRSAAAGPGRAVMVRRQYATPIALPPRAKSSPDGWLARGPAAGPVTRVYGPYVIAGGWWSSGVQREYHYLETSRGSLLWAFYDRRRCRWFLHGVVE